MRTQKPPSQLRFLLPSIIITITSNEPGNTEAHKTDRNRPITNHKPWPFEPVKVKFCFLGGPLRWLMAAKNEIVSGLLNFRIRMFVKSAVIVFHICSLVCHWKLQLCITEFVQHSNFYAMKGSCPALQYKAWIGFLSYFILKTCLTACCLTACDSMNLLVSVVALDKLWFAAHY